MTQCYVGCNRDDVELWTQLPGAARLVLVDGLGLLQPESAVLEAMLEGWARQQRVRFLKSSTIGHRVRMVRRMVEFSNLVCPSERLRVVNKGLTP